MIEKILERLEETDINDIQMVVSETLVKYGFPRESIVQDEIWDALDGLSTNKFAISIVQEVAKEYGNGWIPCSERLPDFCGYSVLLTVENAFGQRDVCKAFTNYMKEGKLLFYTNEKEFCSELTSSKLSDAWKPIAWQPLPAPYQKGE